MRILVFLICILSFSSFSQRNMKDSVISQFIVAANYKFNFTAADLYNIWGFNSSVGVDVSYKFKNNLTVGIDGSFIFGNRMKDSSTFESVINSYGQITGFSGEPAVVIFGFRGVNSNLKVGYLMNRFGHNPNSGLWMTFGAGFLMHHTRIESLYDVVPQLEGDYRKGYDRLTVGFSSSQFIGYLYQADRKFTNFYFGIEIVEGFTKNIRTYNFDIGGPDYRRRLDIMYGVKLGWMIPFYKRSAKSYFFD